ncbi:Uncharacterised protein [Klebsiella aerogenes]|nr:Uncharacterised protein [Klebsiella aerogenes]
MGEFVAMMLVDVAQNTLGAVLLQLRQSVQLDQLAQLLSHRLAFNHKVVDKAGAVGERQGFEQGFLRFALASCLPVQLVEQQQVAVEIAHQTQRTRIFVQLFQHHFRRFEIAQQDLRRAMLRHWLCRKWLLANSGFGVWRSQLAAAVLSPVICQ